MYEAEICVVPWVDQIWSNEEKKKTEERTEPNRIHRKSRYTYARFTVLVTRANTARANQLIINGT